MFETRLPQHSVSFNVGYNAWFITVNQKVFVKGTNVDCNRGTALYVVFDLAKLKRTYVSKQVVGFSAIS
jgi:outer membrane protease